MLKRFIFKSKFVIYQPIFSKCLLSSHARQFKQVYLQGKVSKFELDLQRNDLIEIIPKSQDKTDIKSHFYSIASYILPKGFPNSVGINYEKYITYQAIDNVSGTICGVLAMQSLLFAVGLNATTAIPLGASINWIMKDGLGQLGGVIFASFVNNRFDVDPKRWRFVACLSMTAASLLEIISPLCPSLFLIIASLANVGKNISFLAASASRAAIHKTFAIKENLADITAKSGSQSILSSTIGTFIGISIASVIGGDFDNSLIAFITCAFINCTANYKSLQQVTLNSVSLSRLDYLIDTYVNKNGILLTPADLRDQEVYLAVPELKLLSSPLCIGSDINKLNIDVRAINLSFDIFSEEKYLIFIKNLPDNISNDKCEVHLIFKENAKTLDIIDGILFGYLTRKEIFKDNTQIICKFDQTEYSNFFRRIKKTFDNSVPSFKAKLLELSSYNQKNLNCFTSEENNNHHRSSKNYWIIEELMLETKFARISDTIDE